METFDYASPAEIYASKGRGASKRPMSYRRFDTSAEAIRYAVEVLAPDMQFGTVMETGDDRFVAADIRRLYEAPGYPLQRVKPD
jgi:hypothetical protein